MKDEQFNLAHALRNSSLSFFCLQRREKENMDAVLIIFAILNALFGLAETVMAWRTRKDFQQETLWRLRAIGSWVAMTFFVLMLGRT